jgi:hypothetical protein
LRTLSALFERQPLLLGAVGLAIGAGIAASVPVADAEKQAMREASDFLREKVGEATADVTAQIKETADAALSEAKAQGITPDIVTEAVGVMRNKVTGEKSVKERTTGSTAASLSRGIRGGAPEDVVATSRAGQFCRWAKGARMIEGPRRILERTGKIIQPRKRISRLVTT